MLYVHIFFSALVHLDCSGPKKLEENFSIPYANILHRKLHKMRVFPIRLNVCYDDPKMYYILKGKFLSTRSSNIAFSPPVLYYGTGKKQQIYISILYIYLFFFLQQVLELYICLLFSTWRWAGLSPVALIGQS